MRIRISGLLSAVIFFALQGDLFAQVHWDMAKAGDIGKVLTIRDQEKVHNDNLPYRLDTILPQIMRREGIDMWLVLNLECNEDPVYMSLIKRPAFNARRLSILVFHDDPEQGFKKLNASWWGKWSCGPMYEDLLTDRTKGGNHQFTVLAEYIKKHDPKKIGINYAPHWEYHDDFSMGQGLSAFLKGKLERSLPFKYRKRLVSAEKVCIGWLETRSPRELSLYPHICGLSHDLIAEFYSNKVIIPDTTTAEDLSWWIRDRMHELGLEPWFQPDIDILRSPQDSIKYGKDDRVIRRGDILHCDIGFAYMGLNTDMQHNAYVCRAGETEPPEGIKKLLAKGNRVQEILLGEFQNGRTGNEILNSALLKAKAEGIDAKIYTHPIGIYGHSSGMMVGMWERQEFIPGTGEHPLYPNTVYSIELGVADAVPEWSGAKVYLGGEEEAVFTEKGVDWIDGYPRTFYLIQ